MEFNRVILVGNLTRDPELTYIQSGTALCKFGLAVNRRWKKDSGDSGEEVCFVDIEVWGKQAENVNEYLKKGSPALLEGRLAFDTWESQDGQRRSKHKVVAERVQFFPRNASPSTQPGDAGAFHAKHSAAKRAAALADHEVPF